MVNKRQFLKSAIIAGLASTQLSQLSKAAESSHTANKKKKWKHWVWINPSQKDKVEDLQKLYALYHEAGIRGIFFEADSEMHFRAAKHNKLEAHRWMWTMNRGEKDLLEMHPDWYAVNQS
jgi:hypothetical protein